MCGIFGLFNVNPANRVRKDILSSMGELLDHRGPDNLGVWVKGNIGLGHTRLSIVDLRSSGNQPMCNEDGTVWITFNGEIYNFQALRDWLEGKGHVFSSNTDTEVIIHLWEEEGENCVTRLKGMFAFALWDDGRQVLFLARDRFGKKPLFYIVLQDKILFASEIKSILEYPGVLRAVDIEAIHHYLTYQSVPSPLCAFRGIRKVPPAHYLLIKNGECRKQECYWKLSYNRKLKISDPCEERKIREEIIERLKESVRIRLISDVPLGAFLSGGLDSSLIVALMKEVTGQPPKTFSIGFEHEEYNELSYARMVAKRLETEHHEFIVKPDALSVLPKLVWHYNEPFADPAAIPTYYLSEIAKKYVTVVLNGDGGDENFAGYPRYQINCNDNAVYDMQSYCGRYLGNRTDERISPERLLYYRRITHFHEAMKSELYTDDMKVAMSGCFSFDIMLDMFEKSGSDDFLDSAMYADFNLYLPDTLMPKVDVATMAHSLEARSPMLDHEFVEFVASIPSEMKLSNGSIGKAILKEASEPYLPNEVIYRNKMGFGVPLDHWFRNELKEMAHDTLLSRMAKERGYFKPDYIENLLARHQHGENWQYHIWNLLMLELWHLMFIDGVMAAPNPSKGADIL